MWQFDMCVLIYHLNKVETVEILFADFKFIQERSFLLSLSFYTTFLRRW